MRQSQTCPCSTGPYCVGVRYAKSRPTSLKPVKMCVGLLLCLVAVASGAQRDALGFRFTSFSRAVEQQLVLAGQAQIVAPAVVLTPNASGRAGAVWAHDRVWVDEFVCNFTFLVEGDAQLEGGDGVALVFYGLPGLPVTGKSVAGQPGGLGYGSGLLEQTEPDSGLPFSVAIELDTHFDATLGDPQQQHVAVHAMGEAPNSANETQARVGELGLANLPPSLRRGPQTVSLAFKGGVLSVLVGQATRPAVVIPNLTLLQLTGPDSDGGGVFVGVSASTGRDSRDRHSLLQWSFAYTGNTLSARNSRVSGPGWEARQITAGEDETFSIRARDLYNHSYLGPVPVFYALIGDLSVPALPAGGSDPSLFKVTYQGTRAGPLVLQVLTFQDVVVDTAQTECKAGPLDPSASVLGGDWRGGTVAREYAFTVAMTDGYGNGVEPPRAPAIDVRFDPPGPSEQQQPCGDCGGVYTFIMSCPTQGIFGMTIRVNGVVVQGSPFSVSFSGGQVAPEQATVGGAGVAGGVAGETIVFFVQLRDRFQNPVTASGNVTAQIAGEGMRVEGSVSEGAPGRYDVRWSTTRAGWYAYTFFVDGIESVQSPVSQVRVVPQAAASLSLSLLQPPEGTVRAGQVSVWLVQGRDSLNNTLQVAPPFDLKVVGSLSGSLNFTALPVAPGVLGVELVPPVAETLTWSVGIGGLPLAGSPYVFVVSAGEVSALASSATGPGLGLSQPVSLPVTFSLALQDGHGGVVADPSAVQVSVSGDATVSTAVQGQSIVVTYSLPSSGLYEIRATVARGPFAGMSVGGLPVAVAGRGQSDTSLSKIAAIAMAVVATLAIVVMLLLLGFRKSLVMRSAVEAEKQNLFVAADETEGDNN